MANKTIFEEIQDQKSRGVLLVLTGPTGAGKDSLFELLLQDPSIIKITTTTSRSLREKESEGNPYHFISRQEFEKMIADSAFFEWVEFRGELYGTQKKTLENALKKNVNVIWHIEAKGVKNIKQKVKEMVKRSVFVYLTANSVEELKRRVEIDENNNKMHKRWNESLVNWEMEQYDDCDYLVVNEHGRLKETASQILSIMETKKLEVIKK